MHRPGVSNRKLADVRDKESYVRRIQPGDRFREAYVRPLTSGTSFTLLLSRAGNRMTSVFNLCSAASPAIGLDSIVGLSFAETHGATPGSGVSLVTLPYIPATN